MALTSLVVQGTQQAPPEPNKALLNAFGNVFFLGLQYMTADQNWDQVTTRMINLVCPIWPPYENFLGSTGHILFIIFTLFKYITFPWLTWQNLAAEDRKWCKTTYFLPCKIQNKSGKFETCLWCVHSCICNYVNSLHTCFWKQGLIVTSAKEALYLLTLVSYFQNWFL